MHPKYVADLTQVRDITKLSGYPRSNDKTRLEQSNYSLASGNIWTEGIAFYFDGVGFAHKYNPYDQAMSPKTMTWRWPHDGLSFERTAKGSHEGTGGRVAHFLCAIAHNKGMILAEQYEGRLNGNEFAKFVREQFPNLFERSNNPVGKMFLQDGDPSQNSRKTQDALDEVGGRIFHIPPRSPDINPIENVFNQVKRKMEEDAIVQFLTHETYEDFCSRAKNTLLNYCVETINRTIESMDKRMGMIIKNRGQRIKY